MLLYNLLLVNLCIYISCLFMFTLRDSLYKTIGKTLTAH